MRMRDGWKANKKEREREEERNTRFPTLKVMRTTKTTTTANKNIIRTVLRLGYRQ